MWQQSHRSILFLQISGATIEEPLTTTLLFPITALAETHIFFGLY
jgi:hypothetical protein